MTASNEDRRARRNELRALLLGNAERLAELKRRRERDPHSVDQHAINDASRGDHHLVAELVGIGGNPKKLWETN
jgi:hypothetical protein